MPNEDLSQAAYQVDEGQEVDTDAQVYSEEDMSKKK